MATVWVCPACSQRNALDASECSSCGRWASVFDLERTVEVGDHGDVGDFEDEDWEPIDDQVAPAPDPETAAEPVPMTFDTEPVVTTTPEQAPQPNQRRFPRWVIPVAVASFVAIRALLENV